MRWLMMALFVSLVALLIAAAGVTLHILIQRRALLRHSSENNELAVKPDANAEPEI